MRNKEFERVIVCGRLHEIPYTWWEFVGSAKIKWSVHSINSRRKLRLRNQIFAIWSDLQLDYSYCSMHYFDLPIEKFIMQIWWFYLIMLKIDRCALRHWGLVKESTSHCYLYFIIGCVALSCFNSRKLNTKTVQCMGHQL